MLPRSRGAAVGRYTPIYMNVEFMVEGLKSGFYRCLLRKFPGGACPHTPLESSVFFDIPSLPNYRGSKITANDLFLQILPVLRHTEYSSEYVKFAEMNE